MELSTDQILSRTIPLAQCSAINASSSELRVGLMWGIALCWTVAAPVVAGPQEIVEICQVLREFELASQEFSVDVRYHPGSDVGGEQRVLGFESEHIEDSAGRTRVKRIEQRALQLSGENVVGNVTVLAVYDGTNLKRMSGRDGKFVEGRVSNHPEDLPWAESPREFLTHYFSLAISALLTEHPGGIVERSDGLLTVETAENLVERDGSRRKARFKIDENFSIRERSSLIQFVDSPAWHTYVRITSDEFALTDIGLRVPARGVVEHYDTTQRAIQENGKPVLRSRAEFQFANWDFSPHLDDKTFELEFPSGVHITDVVQGKSYTTSAVLTDGLLDSHLEGVAGIAAEQHRKTRKRTVLVVANLILVAGLIVMWFRRRRRSQ